MLAEKVSLGLSRANWDSLKLLGLKLLSVENLVQSFLITIITILELPEELPRELCWNLNMMFIGVDLI